MFHVVHIVDAFNVGGAQRLLVTFAEEARSHPVHTTVINLSKQTGSAIPEQLVSLGCEVLHCPSSKKSELTDVGRVMRLAGMLRSRPVDVVHMHLSHANIIGSIAARLAGKPPIPTFHSIHLTDTPMSGKERMEYAVARWLCPRVLAVGGMVAESHRPFLGSTPISMIHNGVQPIATLPEDERQAFRAQLVGDASRPLLISLGRLSPEKGFEDFLNAFALLRRSFPQAALLLAGEGPGRNALEAMIESLGLTGHAFLLGARQDVATLLAAADIYVCSSHWEGLPLSILEGMSAGLPIVSTQVGAIPEVVTEETGILVPPQQPEALKEAFWKLLADPETMRAMGQAAKQRFLEQYSASTWFERWMDMYRQVSGVRQGNG